MIASARGPAYGAPDRAVIRRRRESRSRDHFAAHRVKVTSRTAQNIFVSDAGLL
jgi:hypothetical protein